MFIALVLFAPLGGPGALRLRPPSARLQVSSRVRCLTDSAGAEATLR